jgi:hypothetical protein
MRTALPRQSILRPALTASVAMVLVCAGGVAVAGQATPPADPPEGASGLMGTVLDRTSDEPVVGAVLELTLPSGERVARVEADSLGGFAFDAVAAGAYRLSIRGFGYKPVSRDLILERRAETELTASLVPDAVDIEPVVVTVERRTLGAMRDFDRRRALGIGSFITRADIERRRPHQVTDLFRYLAGVRVVPDRYGDARLLLHGQCVPRLYIDGVAAYEGTSLDMILHPEDVEGIEVYTTATAPPQYARDACGVLVVWTRVPQRVDGKGSWWKPLLFLGGLAGALAILR